MLSVFSDLKSLLKLSKISIDNWVFKLHYKLTVIILIAFSILVNARQYFGDPIDCTIAGTEIANIIDTYCWFNSYSFVREDGAVFFQVQKYHISHGTENSPKFKSPDVQDYKRVKQTYYQWIGVVLLLQAACFFLPRFIWKNLFEGGRVKELVDGMQSHTQNDAEFEKRQEKVIEYIKCNKGHHIFYAFTFFFCELLNFFNVLVQIFITDWFLGHAFLKYGMEWLWYDIDNDIESIKHPSFRYFPKETACDITYGSAAGLSNTPNVYHAKCILPIQIFNEKIYLFLWFYFITLSVITGLFLLYRVAVLFSPHVRHFLFSRRAWATDEKISRKIVHDFDVGDWFFMYQVMKNMDPFQFSKLMERVYKKLCNESPSNQDQNLQHIYSHNLESEEKFEKVGNKGGSMGLYPAPARSPH